MRSVSLIKLRLTKAKTSLTSSSLTSSSRSSQCVRIGLCACGMPSDWSNCRRSRIKTKTYTFPSLHLLALTIKMAFCTSVISFYLFGIAKLIPSSKLMPFKYRLWAQLWPKREISSLWLSSLRLSASSQCVRLTLRRAVCSFLRCQASWTSFATKRHNSTITLQLLTLRTCVASGISRSTPRTLHSRSQWSKSLVSDQKPQFQRNLKLGISFLRIFDHFYEVLIHFGLYL